MAGQENATNNANQTLAGLITNAAFNMLDKVAMANLEGYLKQGYEQHKVTTPDPQRQMDLATFMNKQLGSVKELVPALLRLRADLTGDNQIAFAHQLGNPEDTQRRAKIIEAIQEELKKSNQTNVSRESVIRDFFVRDEERRKQQAEQQKQQSPQNVPKAEQNKDLIRSIVESAVNAVKTAVNVAGEGLSMAGKSIGKAIGKGVLAVASFIPVTAPIARAISAISTVMDKAESVKSVVSGINTVIRNNGQTSLSDKAAAVGQIVHSILRNNATFANNEISNVMADKIISKLPLDAGKRIVGQLAGLSYELNKDFNNPTQAHTIPSERFKKLHDIFLSPNEEMNPVGLAKKVNLVGTFINETFKTYAHKGSSANDFIDLAYKKVSESIPEAIKIGQNALTPSEANRTALTNIFELLLKTHQAEAYKQAGSNALGSVKKSMEDNAVNLASLLHKMTDYLKVDELAAKGVSKTDVTVQVEHIFNEAMSLQNRMKQSPAMKDGMGGEFATKVGEFLSFNLDNAKSNTLKMVSDIFHNIEAVARKQTYSTTFSPR